jgi:hypothetical protein
MKFYPEIIDDSVGPTSKVRSVSVFTLPVEIYYLKYDNLITSNDIISDRAV